jgi:hypothetical protein
VTKKFDITGIHTVQTAKVTSDIDEDMEHFIAGAESLTTMTVQIPERLKRALKRLALDRDMTIKNLLMHKAPCGRTLGTSTLASRTGSLRGGGIGAAFDHLHLVVDHPVGRVPDAPHPHLTPTVRTD